MRLLTGADAWGLHAESSVGLRRIVVSDGPVGVRGEDWDERDPSANVPSPTALAATWNPSRAERIGGLLAQECHRKRVHVLLAPTVNLQRSPYGGRHFEMFSEDPLLTAVLSAAYVRGLQTSNIAATVKHFVANDSETDRYNADVIVDERTLRELYLAPFEVVVREAEVWAVMAAYNKTNGYPMTESPLLREILHSEWGFDGVTMTDWSAARSTSASARSGVDLVMPGPVGPWGRALIEDVREGRVSEDAIDDKVARLLRLADRVQALGEPVPPAERADAHRFEVAAELRATAAESFVLLRNEAPAGVDETAPMLPLDSKPIHRVAVLGPNAAVGRTLGGGSATVFPPYVISPLDGLRDALGAEVEIEHATAVRAHSRIPPADTGRLTLPGSDEPGIEVQFLDEHGIVIGREHRRASTFNWQHLIGGLQPHTVKAFRVAMRLRVSETGRYTVGGSGLGHFVLTVDGVEAFDAHLQLPDGADPAEGLMRPPQHAAVFDWASGRVVELELSYEPAASRASFDAGMIAFQLNLEPPYPTDEVALEEAVAIARRADVAVVVVGTNEEVESEGYDRQTLRLPGRQDELVRRVAQVNPRTIVVVNAGAPVLLPWRDQVPAILVTWFPGQEFGHALADVLLGLAEPGGRLPTTWPADEDRAIASTRPINDRLEYLEGLHIGYRRFLKDEVAPAYWFGHGLGYTTWKFGDLKVIADDQGGATVVVPVRNTGARPGRTVVQVYAARPSSAIDRPARWLAGFTTITTGPGEEVEAKITIRARTFEHWDVDNHRWTCEPGVFDLHLARSAGDLVSRASIVPRRRGTA